jgi:hypothetical protein
MTIKISQLGNLTAYSDDTLFPVVANVAGVLTTLKSNGSVMVDYVANTITSGDYTFGNVVPSANVTYNLGSPTAQWNDLYLSGSTIYIGGETLSVSSGNLVSSASIQAPITATNLNVTGTQITFAQGAYIDETEIVGVSGYYGLALNSADDGIVGINALDSDANVATSVIASNVSVTVNTNDSGNVLLSHSWTFQGVAGSGQILFPDLTVQDTAWTAQNSTDLANVVSSVSSLEANAGTQDGSISSLEANVSTLQSDVSDLEANAVTQQTAIDSLEAGVVTSDFEPSANATYSLGTSGSWMEFGYFSANVYVGSHIVADHVITNDFDATGTISTASIEVSGNVTAGTFNGNVNATSIDTTAINLSQGGQIADQNVGYFSSVVLGPANGAAAIGVVASNGAPLTNSVEIRPTEANVAVYHSDGTDVYTWKFNEDGELVFPDTTIQTSAYTATFANATPSSSSDTGTKGDIKYDASYVYFCVDTNTWVRVTRDTW